MIRRPLDRVLHGQREPALGFEGGVRRPLDRVQHGDWEPVLGQYELAILRKGMRLAHEDGKLAAVPPFPRARIANARTGFFEPEDLERLCLELPSYLVPVARFGYLTGWRTSEVSALAWEVDFDAGVIRLEVGTTKNEDGRTFPLDALPALAQLLREQRSYTEVFEAVEGRSIPWVFHRRGQPLRDFYHAWRSACDRAGLPGKLFHDLRRTAVRNLERAGVSRSTGTKLTGHKTEAVYRRYAIVCESDLRDGVAKLAALMDRQRAVQATSE